jgi:hypothetical protein
MENKKKKNREMTMPFPRVYFFFTGFFSSFLTGFFSSFLTGFLATKITSGFNV